MPFSDHAALAKALLPSVFEAAEVEMRHFLAGVAVEHKADRSPVTEADRQAEAIIVAALRDAMPGVPVVAEEAVSAGTKPDIDGAFFLVDPLDGTREFIANGREFTINIGLVCEGGPVFGIIYAPALARLYLTIGADEALSATVPPSTERVATALDGARALSTRTPDTQALVAIQSRSRKAGQLDSLFKRHKVSELQRAASSFKFCLVAEGLSDLYAQFGETCEWDTAAGEAILTAAGGAVMALDGGPLRYGGGEKGFLNPPFIAWGRKAMQPW